jgi:hypothetical protein
LRRALFRAGGILFEKRPRNGYLITCHEKRDGVCSGKGRVAGCFVAGERNHSEG